MLSSSLWGESKLESERERKKKNAFFFLGELNRKRKILLIGFHASFRQNDAKVEL